MNTITAIDEGNKIKRVMIGFGRDASDVRTHVTVSSFTNGKKTVVLEFDLNSTSDKKRGLLQPWALAHSQ